MVILNVRSFVLIVFLLPKKITVSSENSGASHLVEGHNVETPTDWLRE